MQEPALFPRRPVVYVAFEIQLLGYFPLSIKIQLSFSPEDCHQESCPPRVLLITGCDVSVLSRKEVSWILEKRLNVKYTLKFKIWKRMKFSPNTKTAEQKPA